MQTLYLEVFSEVDENLCCKSPIQSIIIAFALKYCNENSINLVLKQTFSASDESFELCLSKFRYEIYPGEDLAEPANYCQLPVIVLDDGSSCIAGLCAVTRQIFKSNNNYKNLLGFKQNCLYACAEVSLWTRFCEIEAPCAAVSVFHKEKSTVHRDLLRFEAHLAQPVRIHNIQKMKQDMIKAGGGNISAIPDARLQMTPELSHIYAEGPSISIADVILWPCFHIMLHVLSSSLKKKFIPLVTEWHMGLMDSDECKRAITVFSLPNKYCIEDIPIGCDLQVPQESLYKSDPKRYKPRHRIFTKQDDVDESLKLVKDIQLSMLSNKFATKVFFEWDDVPLEARPHFGAVPEHRAGRKSEQLKAMAQAVMSVCRDGDIIIDFCAGSGHLGLLLACSLKKCTVILLENKEESINRAKERAAKLQLKNILFLQTNVDYFTGHFTVGVSLHACGVATDLVLETCITRAAAFVSCPCCYGSVQPNHVIQYPRSEEFRHLLTERQYLVLGHAADQVHEKENEKTMQGLLCMDLVDGDRCLRAKAFGYQVFLTKLDPPTCTPKNNLIIGIPAQRL